MRTIKTQIVFPEELLQELDRVVKERQRSDFVVDGSNDVFNLNNQRRVTEVETTVDEEFGQRATVNFPRNIRFGMNFAW